MEFTPSKGWLMARTAGQMPQRLYPFDPGALVDAAVPPFGANGILARMGERQDARAIAYSGLAALLALPILLLASMLLGVPLAAPAAIALGYLASSYALASDHVRSAAAINGAVLVGLVVWGAGVLIAGEGVSRIAVAAALIAPLFAAAPAVARLILAPRDDRAASVAQRNAACLDRLAPKEAVLVVRRDGTLLAATRAAQTALRLTGEAKGRDVSRFIALLDRPKLTDAIARCQAGGEAIEIAVHVESGARSGRAFTADVTADGDGAVSIRLAEAARRPKVLKVSRPEKRMRTWKADTGPVCDVREAVEFAMRHAAPIAETRRVLVTADIETGVAVKCERQICRRILSLMTECALMQSSAGATLHLTGRALKSVVLLRLVGGARSDGNERADNARSILRRVVEDAGGTLVVDQCADEMRISVRLDVAVSRAGETKGVECGGRS